jgi:hypothetical protein
VVFWVIVGIVVVLLVVGLLLPGDAKEGFGWLTAMVAGVGALIAAATWWIRRRPLKGDDGPELARSYVARLYLGIALAEIPVAVGFAGTLVADVPWPVVTGVGWSLVALSLVAPTNADVDRRQAQLADAGSAVSLREALGATA